MTFSEMLSRYRKSPAEAMWATHKMKDGDACWSCGSVFSLASDYPSYNCAHCHAFFPRCCSGCRDRVMPVDDTKYGEPPPFCDACLSDKSRMDREKLVNKIPDLVRRPALCSYRGYAHRKSLDTALREYLSGELLTPNLYVYGPPGTGKSVAVARCAWRLISGDRDIQSFIWATESMAVRYATEQSYGIVGERYHELVHCDLLVIDEVGTAFNRAGDKARDRIVEMLRTRLENLAKRTLFISNRQPLMDATFGEAVGSRFRGTTKVAHVDGPDLRGGGGE
jgi:hypothetical protein